jgi:hypothetical protein
MKRNFNFKFSGWMVVILLLCTEFVAAQNERSLYFMPDVPQSRYINPAHFPDHNLNVGLPFLSSFRFGVENTFNYDDIFQKRGDSILLDRSYMLDNLIDNNAINFDMMIEYLSVGFKHSDNYFSFRIADVGNASAVLTKETLRFAFFGNGNEEFLGQTVNLSDNAINFSYYREYAFGFTRKINGKLNIGTNIKYLQGIANLYTNDFRFNLETDPDDFTLTMRSNLDFNLSAPGIDGDATAGDFMPNGNNSGFAFDFGVQYQINEKLSASAGLVNLGSITWNSNLKNFRTIDPDKEFVYSGFDLNDYFDNYAFDNEQINNILDSISDELGIVETATNYRTPLPAWINLNANYKLTENSGLGILLRNRFLKDQNWTTVSLAYTHSFNNMVNLMVSNTFAKRSYFTPGFGLSVNLGPVQMYLVNENFVAPLLFNSAKLYSIRFGVNFIFRDKVILPTEPQNGYPEMNNDQNM